MLTAVVAVENVRICPRSISDVFNDPRMALSKRRRLILRSLISEAGSLRFLSRGRGLVLLLRRESADELSDSAEARGEL